MAKREVTTKDIIIPITLATKDRREVIVTMDTNPKVARKEAATTTRNGEAAAKKEVIKHGTKPK